MLQPLTFVKIMDRVLYRADGVAQIPVVSGPISGMDSGRLGDDELLFFNNNFVVLSQKNLFRSAMKQVRPRRVQRPDGPERRHQGSG